MHSTRFCPSRPLRRRFNVCELELRLRRLLLLPYPRVLGMLCIGVRGYLQRYLKEMATMYNLEATRGNPNWLRWSYGCWSSGKIGLDGEV